MSKEPNYKSNQTTDLDDSSDMILPSQDCDQYSDEDRDRFDKMLDDGDRRMSRVATDVDS